MIVSNADVKVDRELFSSTLHVPTLDALMVAACDEISSDFLTLLAIDLKLWMRVMNEEQLMVDVLKVLVETELIFVVTSSIEEVIFSNVLIFARISSWVRPNVEVIMEVNSFVEEGKGERELRLNVTDVVDSKWPKLSKMSSF